jgi:hypothetical protein
LTAKVGFVAQPGFRHRCSREGKKC